MYVYSPDIPSRFRRHYIHYPQVSELTLSQSHLAGENAAQFSTAVAIHTVPIFVPSGTHYCWMDRGSVDSKFTQGFYTRTVLRAWESNPRHQDLGTNALTIPPRAPLRNAIILKHIALKFAFSTSAFNLLTKIHEYHEINETFLSNLPVQPTYAILRT